VTRSTRWLVLAAGIATVTVSMMTQPTEASAQRRVARRPVRSVVYVSSGYRPLYYRPFYRPYYGWYGGWHGYGWYPYHSYFWQPYPYPYGYYYRDRISEARIQVEPKQAQVFVDGYFVGEVDDFDGWSQRLRLEPGEHELEIFLEGYRTYRQQVLFRPGATLKIEHAMQPLGAGEASEPRPRPDPNATRQPTRRPSGTYPGPAPRSDPPPAREGGEAPGRQPEIESRDYGAMAIRVQPMDAEVIVDGERWDSPQAGDLTLQLSEGTHRVEVRKDGFRTYSAEIRVRRGETTSLNVSLTRQ
jgi:hypothetical protein